jgi:hypothetical protein
MVTGAAVLVDATTGQLGVAVSSQRFKDEIKPMETWQGLLAFWSGTAIWGFG